MLILKTYNVPSVLAAIRNARRRQEKKFFIPGTDKQARITPTLVVLANKGTTCVCCGEPAVSFAYVIKDNGQHCYMFLTKDNTFLTKDHIIPKSVGGSNAPDNYQTMCQPCNLKKGCKHDNFRYMIDVLSTLAAIRSLYDTHQKQSAVHQRIQKFRALFVKARDLGEEFNLEKKRQKWYIDGFSQDFFVGLLQKHLQLSKIKQKQIKKVPYERSIL